VRPSPIPRRAVPVADRRLRSGVALVPGAGVRVGAITVCAVTICALIAVGVLAACGRSASANGHGQFAAAPTGSPGVGAASGIGSAPASTGSATGAATATPSQHATSAPAGHAYPSDYARAILSAWAAHDTSYLTLLTNSSTKTQLYGYGSLDQHWTLASSEAAAGSSYASFFDRDGDWIGLRSINEQTAAHHWHAGSVQTWSKISYPSDPTAYVKYYMDAYVDGNTARMTKLGSPAMTTHFAGLSSKPDSGYSVGTPDGTAGHTHIEVTESSISFDVIFRVVDQDLGSAGAIEGCDSGC
jgi:hypothetical protein